MRLTELLVAIAICQRGVEHLGRETWLFGTQMGLAALLLAGYGQPWVISALWFSGLWQLHRFDGPYNGGSDKMVLLVLTCLLVAHWAPAFGGVALGYLAVQLTLSYLVSGWVKLRSAEWRHGNALAAVFMYSAYPTSEALRSLARRRTLMKYASLGVIAFEVLFAFSLMHPASLFFALSLAFVFHLANAVLFGLNRFVWAWLSAFPALVWFQSELLI